jgi:restriction system protein
MARRKRQSALEDLIELAALLPWWLAVTLGIGAYVLIHPYAVMEVPVATGPQKMGDLVGKQLYKTFATFLQYIVPFAFFAGAISPVAARRKRAALHHGVSRGSTANALNGMDWREFEMLVGESFRRRGYAVTETGGSADGGVDLVLSRDGETYLVQCKQWRALKVGVTIVRELYGVMAARGAAGSFVVTSGTFTQEAREFAAGRNIELIDGHRLFAMIKGVSASEVRDSVAEASTPLPVPARPSPSVAESTSPLCPKCGGSMVLRTARKGANAGQTFYGCSNFPRCKGIQSA